MFSVKSSIKFLIFVLVVIGSNFAFSQTEPRLRPLDEANYQRAVEGLDYSKDQPPPPPKPQNVDLPKPRPDWHWSWGSAFWSAFAQVFFIVAGAVLVGFLIFKIMTGPRSKKITAEPLDISSLDRLEDRLLETDLDLLLKKAIADGQFSLALRLRYLLIIKQLSLKNWISWSREKTNRDFLNELAATNLATDFRVVTTQFERVWYGDLRLSAAEFAAMEPRFEAFFQKI